MGTHQLGFSGRAPAAPESLQPWPVLCRHLSYSVLLFVKSLHLPGFKRLPGQPSHLPTHL